MTIIIDYDHSVHVVKGDEMFCGWRDPSCVAPSSFHAASVQLPCRQIVSEISTNISCRCGALLVRWWQTAAWAMVQVSMRLCCCRRLGTWIICHMPSESQELKEKDREKELGRTLKEFSTGELKIEMQHKRHICSEFIYSYLFKGLWIDKNLH